MLPEDHWLPVPGYQGWYEVSDLGQVYSLARPFTHGGLLRPQLNSAGYRVVRLHKYGRVRTVTVGSLVLTAFAGPASGRRARHGPGGKLDDALANLTWSGRDTRLAGLYTPRYSQHMRDSHQAADARLPLPEENESS